MYKVNCIATYLAVDLNLCVFSLQIYQARTKVL